MLPTTHMAFDAMGITLKVLMPATGMTYRSWAGWLASAIEPFHGLDSDRGSVCDARICVRTRYMSESSIYAAHDVAGYAAAERGPK